MGDFRHSIVCSCLERFFGLSYHIKVFSVEIR